MPRRPICASAANQAGHGLRRHALVTYQQSALPGWSDAFCGEPTGNGHVAIELNSAMMIIDAVRAGLGIGELPCTWRRAIRNWSASGRSGPVPMTCGW